MSERMLPLGDHPRVRITRVVRVQYRVEWEYDGHEYGWDPETGPEHVPTRRRRARFVTGRAVAYRMAAMRLIFSRRDKYATFRNGAGHLAGCRLCAEETGGGPDDIPQCRYHDEARFIVLRDRLARRLRWRDERAAVSS